MGKPIRVALIIGRMERGGVESVMMNYYRHIDRSKVQFDFFVDKNSSIPQKEEIEQLGGRIYYVPPYQKINKYISALIKLFKQNKYKIVHANLNTLSVFPLYAAKRAGVPVRIAHNHSTAGKGETKKNIIKYILRPFAKVNATHYAACSRYAGEWLFGKKTMKNGNVTIFNNAIDLEKFKYNATVRNEVRKQLGLEEKFVVGHVGRFCYQKNQNFLIDIFYKVYKKKPESVLLLIGEGEDMQRIKEKVKLLKLDHVVKFMGNRSDVNRFYQAMDVFVLPSRYEGLPVVGVEAQTAGLPCVFSDKMTRETKMTSNSEFMSIKESAEMWANKIISYLSYKKEDKENDLRDCGYDILQQSDKLLEYYYNIYYKQI